MDCPAGTSPARCRIMPPGLAVRHRPRPPPAPVPCSCRLDLTSLFPDGPPSPPLPLSRCELHELLLALPQELQNSPWRVCFDTVHDGYSLNNFYRRMKQVRDEGEHGIGIFVVCEEVSSSPATPLHEAPTTPLGADSARSATVTSAASSSSTVFGCYTPEVPCLEHSQHAFFGTQSTFVFTYADMMRNSSAVNADACKKNLSPTSSPPSLTQQQQQQRSSIELPTRAGAGHRHPRILSVYPWAREDANREFVVCASSFLGIGGGHDGAAIFVDESLLHGTSSAFCGTFASPPLSGKPRASLRHSEFTILRMVWFKVKDRRGVFACMNLPKREACDCGRVLGGDEGNLSMRLHHGGNRDGWHVCSEDEQPFPFDSPCN